MLSQLWAFKDAWAYPHGPGWKEVTQDSAEWRGLKQGVGEHRGAASKEDFLEEEDARAEKREVFWEGLEPGLQCGKTRLEGH